MGIFRSIFEKREKEITNPREIGYWLAGGGRRSNAGVNVNATTAMRQSAVFACVHLLSSTFAYVPWITYRRLPRGKERALEHQLYPILHNRPNPEQSSFTFRSIAMAHALLYGNGVAEIEFDGSGQPIALWPLPAWRVKALRAQDNSLFYQVSLPDGTTKNLPAFAVWHLMGLSTDGMGGLSVISQARESIGLALATEEFGARFFSGGANVGGVAIHPNVLSEPAAKRLQATLDEQYAGLGQAHRLMLLEEGMKYEKVGIPNNDSQFLETRTYQVVDIARMFRVPPHMIAELSKATYSNIENQGIEFVVYTMNPWFVNAEQETNYKLFGLGSAYFTEFLVDGLLRGDVAARATFYKELFYLGSISPNDIREKENWNPIADPRGDETFVGANMVPLSMAGMLVGQELASHRKPKEEIIDVIPWETILSDAIGRIAEREKQNIARALRKNNGSLQDWVEDFYRDFADFIVRQVKPVFEAMGRPEGLDDFVADYVEKSKGHLEGEIKLDGWEQLRLKESLEAVQTR
jgi:HK97 family phage portal protein